MSSKEDYLDSLLQTVNATSASGNGTALQKLAGMEENTGADKSGANSGAGVGFSDEFDMEDLEFPELAALFADNAEEEQPEEVQESVETIETVAAQEAEEAVSTAEMSVEEMTEAAETVEEAFAEEVNGTEDISLEAEKIAELEKAPEPEIMPLKDIEDMDIAELEAMLSGLPFDAGEMPVMSGGVMAEETASPIPEQEATQTAIEDTISDMGIANDADVTDLIDAMGEDGDLAEISELLKRSDNNEMIPDDMADIAAMLGAGTGAGENSGASSDSVTAIAESLEAEDGGNRKKAKKEKKKKEKKQKEPKEKKPGFFKKMFAFLTEDDEMVALDAELGQIDLSQENIAILESLDKESGKGSKKAKKGKKEKKPLFKKKEKQPKEKKEKKPKIKKEKKPKKVKEPKPVVPEVPLKPIGKKKIATGFFFGVTVFGVILLITTYIPGVVDRQESKRAYEDGDYQKVYDLLVTKEVKGNEEKMLKGATLCLQMERKLDSYENYKKLEGMEIEQLHALISGVGKYQKIQAEAVQYGVTEPLKNSYLSILGILQSEYGVSEDTAKALALENDSVAYTKELLSILGMDIPVAEEEDR